MLNDQRVHAMLVKAEPSLGWQEAGKPWTVEQELEWYITDTKQQLADKDNKIAQLKAAADELTTKLHEACSAWSEKC